MAGRRQGRQVRRDEGLDEAVWWWDEDVLRVQDSCKLLSIMVRNYPTVTLTRRFCLGRMQMVFLRLFLAQLSLTYFFRPLPNELTSTRTKHYVTRRPAMNFVGLQRWEEIGEKGTDA